VQDAMEKLIKGRTTLVIAHRLYTVTHADMIHVVENGAIVESGSHTELLARAGRYAQFHLLRLSRGATTEVRERVPIAAD
jgi:ABC-type multidrug transport system fused ATPase/permease subunit